ncbi:MAG: hypothetical protein KDC98_20855 [Planctomycetes bacterium]|nr:hypothetical protein [Planctomycetota bacterium]
MKTLDDLADWQGYRRFLVTELKSLPDGSPFHVSRDDFDFEVKGKPWAGRVVLFGAKGDASMTALKKLGIQFRSGTCSKAGKQLSVTGLSGSLLKAGNKTFDKLPLDCVAVEADGAAKADGEKGAAEQGKAEQGRAEKDKEESGKAEQGKAEKASEDKGKAANRKLKQEVYGLLKEALAGKPSNRKDLIDLYSRAEAHEKAGEHDRAAKALAELKTLLASPAAAADEAGKKDDFETRVREAKAKLRPRLSTVLAGNPANRKILAQLVKQSGEREKAGDWAAAAELLRRLELELAKPASEPEPAEPARPAAVDTDVDADTDVDVEVEDAADEDPGQQEVLVKKQKKAVLLRVKELLAEDPSQREAVGKLVKSVDRHEKAGEFDAVLEDLAALEDLLDDAAGEDDEDVDLDPKSMRDWLHYRKYVRARLRRLPALGDEPEPFYVSRKVFAFDMAGKPWRGNVVLAGAKARSVVKQLKGEGLQFLVGAACVAAKEIVASDVSSAGLKAARKTLKMLRLGFRLRGDADDEADGRATSAAPPPNESSQPSESTSAERTGADVITPGLVKYRSSLLSFARTKDSIRQQLRTLKSEVAALPSEGDLADELERRLDGMFTGIADVVDDAINASSDDREPVTQAVRTRLQEAIAEVGSDPLLEHVDQSPWGLSIKAPLLRALSDIQRAMPA